MTETVIKEVSPNIELEKSQAFLAIKFEPDESNRDRGEALIDALQQAGLSVSCLVQEEGWGQTPSEAPVKDAEARIEQSNLLILDASGDTGFGQGEEVGYARRAGIPVVLICPQGTVLKPTRRDAADAIIEYETLKDLSQKVKTFAQGLKQEKIPR